MKIKAIRYPTTLDKIDDITDDNIDVFVTLDDGNEYTLVVATAKNIETRLKGTGYSNPGWVQQLIVVKELEEALIRKAIEAYAETSDGLYLKVSFLATMFEMEELDQVLERLDKIYNSDDE